MAVSCAPSRAKFVPEWLVLYAALGLGDLAFTLVAFELGASEANPFLKSLQAFGLFEVTKLSLTLLVVCIGVRFQTNRVVFASVMAANALMVAVNVYHVSLLSLFA